MRVSKVFLFTLSACPMGRTMGTVLKELKEGMPELSMATFYVDIQVSETNHYRIKKNPTTLLLTDENQELYRFEEFTETEEIIQVIGKIGKGEMSSSGRYDENQETEERYIIYLYQGDSLVPVELKYRNRTSVKAPRITLINQLIEADIEGLENPFPPNCKLELVQFQGNKGEITLKFDRRVPADEMARMKSALEKSLKPFGIEEIDILGTDESDVTGK